MAEIQNLITAYWNLPAPVLFVALLVNIAITLAVILAFRKPPQ